MIVAGCCWKGPLRHNYTLSVHIFLYIFHAIEVMKLGSGSHKEFFIEADHSLAG